MSHVAHVFQGALEMWSSVSTTDIPQSGGGQRNHLNILAADGGGRKQLKLEKKGNIACLLSDRLFNSLSRLFQSLANIGE